MEHSMTDFYTAQSLILEELDKLNILNDNFLENFGFMNPGIQERINELDNQLYLLRFEHKKELVERFKEFFSKEENAHNCKECPLYSEKFKCKMCDVL